MAAVRTRYARSIEDCASRLDPDVRRELANQIDSTLRIFDGRGEGGVRCESAEGYAEGVSSPYSSNPCWGQVGAPASGEGSGRTAYGLKHGSLETTVKDAINNMIVADLDSALEESRARLADFESREIFLGMRLASYRKALKIRAEHLEASATKKRGGGDSVLLNEGGEDSSGGAPELHKEENRALWDKHRKNEEALSGVAATYRSILEAVELMRRRISDLEDKREDITRQRAECKDFLIAAALAEEMEMVGEELSGVGRCPLPLPASASDMHRSYATQGKDLELC